jgi:hypothetical protein
MQVFVRVLGNWENRDNIYVGTEYNIAYATVTKEEMNKSKNIGGGYVMVETWTNGHLTNTKFLWSEN